MADTLRPGDLIVAVCDNAHEELAANPPGTPGTSDPGATSDTAGGRSWLHWAVPDPVRLGTDDAFEAAYPDLSYRPTASTASPTP